MCLSLSAQNKLNANRLREVAERLGIVLIWWMTKRDLINVVQHARQVESQQVRPR